MDRVDKRLMMVLLSSMGVFGVLAALHHLAPNALDERIVIGIGCLLWATVFACPCIMVLRRGEVLFRDNEGLLSRRRTPVQFWFYLVVEASIFALAVGLGVLVLLNRI